MMMRSIEARPAPKLIVKCSHCIATPMGMVGQRPFVFHGQTSVWVSTGECLCERLIGQRYFWNADQESRVIRRDLNSKMVFEPFFRMLNPKEVCFFADMLRLLGRQIILIVFGSYRGIAPWADRIVRSIGIFPMWKGSAAHRP